MTDTGRRAEASYDAIVLGVGGMGAAACYHLARRGRRVLGLERFDIPHSMGSSHGVTRIIRLAYYEHPSYVPLLRRAYDLWRELETLTGEHLLHQVGSIDAGAETDLVFAGSLASCITHDLAHDVLSGADLRRLYPGYRLPSDYFALFQPDGGFLEPERCIIAHVLTAQAAGAEIHARERVLGWEPAGDGVRVTTDHGTYNAARLVVSAGAWIDQFVPDLVGLARPERQVLAWFQPDQPALFTPERFPVFNLAVPEGRYYGFPVWGVPGFKIGRYGHRGETVDPERFQREPDEADEALLREATARYFPAAAGPTMALRTCLFTVTPDEHFVIGPLPGVPQVIVASPCSGHGFKFCSVVGEILTDLVDTGETAHDIGLFGFERLATLPQPRTGVAA